MGTNSEKGTSKLFSVCEIRPYLYISGYCALTEHKLHQLQITHAVDATNIPKTLRISTIEYLSVPVDDSELGELCKFFKPTADLVRKARDSGGKALVYCAAGISRSAALCITSLMILEGISLKEGYMEVVRTRPIIAPNLGFWRQMIAFEEENNGGKPASVQLLKGMRKPVPSVYLHKSSLLLNKN